MPLKVLGWLSLVILSFTAPLTAETFPTQVGGWQVTPTTPVQLEQACDAGEFEHCNALAWKYLQGEGVEKDGARAAELYEQACDGGYVKGCYNLGAQYLAGDGVPVDEARAAGPIEIACSGDMFVACYQLGLMYQHGKGVVADDRLAGAFYKIACDGGDPSGCFMRARRYELGLDAVRNEAKAATLYEMSCIGGKFESCFNLGQMFWQHRGVSRDIGRAAHLFDRACKGGTLEGCHKLGMLHILGLGAVKDEALGAELYERACEQGLARSCVALASFYEFGVGEIKDESKAASLYARACDEGIFSSCYWWVFMPVRAILAQLGYDFVTLEEAVIVAPSTIEVLEDGAALPYEILRVEERRSGRQFYQEFYIIAEDIEVEREDYVATVIQAARDLQTETSAKFISVYLLTHKEMVGGGPILASARYLADTTWKGNTFEPLTWDIYVTSTPPTLHDLEFGRELARQRPQFVDENSYLTIERRSELRGNVRRALGLPETFVPWHSPVFRAKVLGLNWDLVSSSSCVFKPVEAPECVAGSQNQ